jgi:hypothetical protein
MFWLRLIILAAFLAQQTVCCCGKGCGTSGAVASEHADEQGESQHVHPVIATCGHKHCCQHQSREIVHRLSKPPVIAEVTVADGLHQAPDNHSSHDHHLCVATHLFFIETAPTTASEVLDIADQVFQVAFGMVLVQSLPNSLVAANVNDRCTVVDRTAMQVYVL